jgi:DNA-binding CsgD family transcriptional regulator/tetratricopeptide (TPR) repeat protein
MPNELLERESSLNTLRAAYQQASSGEGHSIFVGGEAGIGKSTLLRVFGDAITMNCRIYKGSCDALFTPRPLAPLYDILWQMNPDAEFVTPDFSDRTRFFLDVIRDLARQPKTVVIIFEDIHWADEATFDFIKFLARRIKQLGCLFLLTYRDNEIDAAHPLRQILGQLEPSTFTRIKLEPLSRAAVDQLAAAKGTHNKDIFRISGGNPFYVHEVLAHYTDGIPQNITDSILAVYNGQSTITQQLWDLLSALPAGISYDVLKQKQPALGVPLDSGLRSGTLVLQDGQLTFKHELYRIAILSAHSPEKVITVNSKILLLFKDDFERRNAIEQIIHHAEPALERLVVAHYAPIAAGQAAAVGAHLQASRLYLKAIEYHNDDSDDINQSQLVALYDLYAYECYLTNNFLEAIKYTTRSLEHWQQQKDTEKIGATLRFLSRLYWFAGNTKDAEQYGLAAVETMEALPSSSTKAMAYSNMAQLKMLSDHFDECLHWGNKAITIATQMGNNEILAHALNNVGSVQMQSPATANQGRALLQESLVIALKHGYQEHVARAYTNLASKSIILKDYANARHHLDDGIRYCQERDLDSWGSYMLSQKARLLFETGEWKEAEPLAMRLIGNETQTPVNLFNALVIAGTLHMRGADTDSQKALSMLQKAKQFAIGTGEPQRILPALAALLEWEWLKSETVIESDLLARTIDMTATSKNSLGYNEFIFWLFRSRKLVLPFRLLYVGFESTEAAANAIETTHAGAVDNMNHAKIGGSAFWRKAGCPYESAMALFDGSDDDKRQSISLLDQLGAKSVCEKLRTEMRLLGIKSIPRGMRRTTQSNPLQITNRELDVLRLLQQQLPNKLIAGKLFISAKTVDHHITSLLFKLQSSSRQQAVVEAVKQGILEQKY